MTGSAMNRITWLAMLAVMCGVMTGCYTRLTSPKEAREFRASYPELDQGLPIDLQNARDNLGSTFLMTAEVYLDGIRRYSRTNTDPGGLLGGDPFRFRPGSEVEIRLIGHPNNDVNGKYRVTTEGTVDIGPISDFPIANRTRRAIREDLANRLSRYYKGSPNPDDPPRVEVNIPSTGSRAIIGSSFDLGSATIFSMAGAGSGIQDTGSSTAGGGGGRVPLTGEDHLLHVLGDSGMYNSGVDWHEVVIARKITTRRVHEDSGLPFTYWVLIVCDLEKMIFEDMNTNLEVRDGDIIILHAEKAPLIVELFRTALAIADVYNAFQGLEFVVEDIFKRNF